MSLEGIDRKLTNAADHNFFNTRMTTGKKEVLGLGLRCLPNPPSMSKDSVVGEFDIFAKILTVRLFLSPKGRDDILMAPQHPTVPINLNPISKVRFGKLILQISDLHVNFV